MAEQEENVSAVEEVEAPEAVEVQAEKPEVNAETKPEPEKRKYSRDNTAAAVKAALRGEKVEYKTHDEEQLGRNRKRSSASDLEKDEAPVKVIESKDAVKAEPEPIAEVKPVSDSKQPPAPYSMPRSWGKNDSDMWGKLTPDIQAKITERENSRDTYLDKIKSEHDTATRYIKDVASIVQPHQALFRSLNVNPMQAMQAVMTDAALAYTGTPQQKIDLVRRVLQTTGLSLADLGANVDNSSEMPQGVQSSSNAELATLRAQLAARNAQLQDIQEQHTQTQANSIRSDIAKVVSAVSAEKGQDGSPLRPHFEALQSEIAIYAKAMAEHAQRVGQMPDYSVILAKAYNMAVQESPEIQAEMQKAAAEKAARERADMERKQKAQAMATPRTAGGVGAAQSAAKPTTFKDALTEALRQQRGE